MNSDRRNPETDQLVADTYKELAGERAPDHLNERVLRLAADGRTRHAFTRAWVRPVAWAATVGLSLAIVLEVTRLPQNEQDFVSVAAPDGDVAYEKSIPKDSRTDVPASAAPTDPAPAAAKRNRTTVPEPHDSLSMNEFAPRKMEILNEAEFKARSQSGPDQRPIAARAEPASDARAEGLSADGVSAEDVSHEKAPALAPFATGTGNKRLGPDQMCAAEVRKTAESWFECIEFLRESDFGAAADSEYERFRRIFPDFEDSPADK